MADFTDVFKLSNSLCRFSPDGDHLAIVLEHRLFVRSTETLQLVALFKCIDNIQDFGWSADGQYLFCASFRLATIQVFSLSDESWTAQIDEGIAGCVAVRWTPDGRHLMSFSDFQLRITIWSLCTKDATYIQYPKFSDRGFGFRNDGKYFALAERTDAKDFVSIYECEDWTLLKRWPVATKDLDGIAWSPDGRFIAVWEPCLEYNVFIYHPDGRLVHNYSAYDMGLGIKTVRWSPSGQFLAVGSYDQKCRLLNYYTWKPLIELTHPTNLPFRDITVYKEVNISDERDVAAWTATSIVRPKLLYKAIQPPVTIPQVRADPEKANPRMGVGVAEFSCTGRYLATRNDNMPTCLWIWDVSSLHQKALIMQQTPIRQVRWNPRQPDRLAFCCGTGFIYFWQADLGCESIEVPAMDFQITGLEWNPDGRSLVLTDKDKFCLSFPIDE
ncbi:Quino protein amine dehydrogenase [Entophlyctis helioformis]|nr:Quino protein amine dehydrogenase [Entophlyctis helioformis]